MDRSKDVRLPTTPRQWHVRVWSLSWPMILANLAIPLVSAVDIAVMGRLPDARYLGAVALGGAVMNALYWMAGFLRMSATGLTAQALGARDRGELGAVAMRGVAAALVLGVLVVLGQGPLLRLALWLFQASPEVEVLAGGYLGIRFWGAPALLLYLVALGVLFGLQRMRAALVISLVLNLTNAGLDLLFVVGFGWGVNGVAAGTVISEWLAAATGLIAANRALAQQGRQWPDAPRMFNLGRLTQLFNISANLVVRTFMVQLPFFLVPALGAFLGDVVLAANAVLLLFLHVTAYGLDGFAHAAETLAGYAYGKRDAKALRLASGYSAVWAGLLACLFGACYWFLGEWLIGLATVLPEVYTVAAAYLPWIAALPLACVWAFMLDGIFIGATRTAEMRNAMFIATAVYLLTLWLSFRPLGNHGVWLSMLTFMAARSVALGLMYPGLERLAGSSVVNSSGKAP